MYLAVKGVDEYGNEDPTAAKLIALIGKNCHRITFDQELKSRYWSHLQPLLLVKSPALPVVGFINQILKNSEKVSEEYIDPPELPVNINIPHEDVHIVRAALISHPLIVTCDPGLKDAVNRETSLKLRAVTPQEAIPLASQR